MYNNYKLVTLMLNVKGGESQTIDGLTKEVNGKLVPMNRTEAELKMYGDISKIGGNPAVKSIKCFLISPDGENIKEVEVEKDIEPTVQPTEES